MAFSVLSDTYLDYPTIIATVMNALPKPFLNYNYLGNIIIILGYKVMVIRRARILIAEKTARTALVLNFVLAGC